MFGHESERDNHIHKEIYPSQAYPRTEADRSWRELPAGGGGGGGAGQVQEKKTDLEIVTSPKGGLHEKYLWKALQKPQIDGRVKRRKKPKLKDSAQRTI